MSEPHEDELTEPTPADVSEPGQEPPDEEAEEAEAEEGTEPSEVPTPEPTEARDDKEIERAYKSIQKEETRHRNRVSEIVGEDAQDWNPCPLCSHFASGFVLPVPADPEVVARTLAAIGMGSLGELRPSPFTEECPTCGGEGELLTHSKRPDTRTVTCETCNARGFVRRQDAPPPAFNPDTSFSVTSGTNGETHTAHEGTMDAAEAKRRMDAAIAQAAGHAVSAE